MTTKPPIKHRAKSDTGPRLRRLGFDESRYDRSSDRWRVRCSQCSALCINGVPCHEHGCPNQRKSRDED